MNIDFILRVCVHWHVDYVYLSVSYFYANWPSLFYQLWIVLYDFEVNTGLY